MQVQQTESGSGTINQKGKNLNSIQNSNKNKYEGPLYLINESSQENNGSAEMQQ